MLTTLPKTVPAGGILARRKPPHGPDRSDERASDIMACAAGRSSVRKVPRTADMRLSKNRKGIPLHFPPEETVSANHLTKRIFSVLSEYGLCAYIQPCQKFRVSGHIPVQKYHPKTGLLSAFGQHHPRIPKQQTAFPAFFSKYVLRHSPKEVPPHWVSFLRLHKTTVPNPGTSAQEIIPC